MAQTVLITLTIAGTDTGPFDLYSDADGYTLPFEVNVSKAALLSGYVSILVPDGATQIRVKSKGACTNFITVPIVGTTFTTTTSTTLFPPTTTTTTTMAGGTTTSTTTIPPPPFMCYEYNVINTSGNQQAAQWTDCCTGFVSYEFMDSGTSINVCSRTEPSGIGLIITGGTVECQDQCTTTTTTTLTPGTTTTTTTSSCKCYMIQDNEGDDMAGATGTYTQCDGELGLWLIDLPLGQTYVCTEYPDSIVSLSGNVSIFLITPSDPLYINCSC